MVLTIGKIRPFVCAAAVTAALLAACGGGGGGDAEPVLSKTPSFADATESAPNTYLVNPSATWKPLQSANDGYLGTVTTIDLSKLVPAGTALAGVTFEVQGLGSYDATSKAGAPNILNNVSAVFVNNQGVAVPQSGASPLPAATTATCDGIANLPDPFAGDFLVPTLAKGRLTVPAGAVQLRVSVDDCFFSDNVRTAADPVRLWIKVAAP